ncbi:hypothetical protein AB9Q07_16170 [Klebsiella quasipneumoniae]|uniref:hypothetical protein n=1 Tax=Klebsiella quasipneumoniae TaxID=1463165 RepID=UPI00351EA2CF
MADNEQPKVFQLGINTVTEYSDGKKVIEQNGHKVTYYPDGSMVAKMNGAIEPPLAIVEPCSPSTIRQSNMLIQKI